MARKQRRSGLIVERTPLGESSRRGDSVKNVVIAIVLFAILAAAVLFLRESPPDINTNINTNVTPEKVVELTQQDIITDPTMDASRIRFYNTGLGDTIDKVTSVMGDPDNTKEYVDRNVTNFYYKERFGCQYECLIYSFKKGSVQRITIYEELDNHLVGETKLTHDKSWVYFNVGIPDTFIDLEAFRRFIYSDRGIELFLKRKQQVGISFFTPDPSKKRVVTEEDPVILDVMSGFSDIESDINAVEEIAEDLPEADNTTFGIY